MSGRFNKAQYVKDELARYAAEIDAWSRYQVDSSREEGETVSEMKERLLALCPEWRERVESVLPQERAAFEAWLSAVERCLPQERASLPRSSPPSMRVL